jgi:hypothetical protein
MDRRPCTSSLQIGFKPQGGFAQDSTSLAPRPPPEVNSKQPMGAVAPVQQLLQARQVLTGTCRSRGSQSARGSSSPSPGGRIATAGSSSPTGRIVSTAALPRPGRTCAGTPSPTQNRRYATALGGPGPATTTAETGLYRVRRQPARQPGPRVWLSGSDGSDDGLFG